MAQLGAWNQKQLKSWNITDLKNLKKNSTRIVFSDLLEKIMEDMSVDDRALIDLVVFKGAGGAEARGCADGGPHPDPARRLS